MFILLPSQVVNSVGAKEYNIDISGGFPSDAIDDSNATYTIELRGEPVEGTTPKSTSKWAKYKQTFRDEWLQDPGKLVAIMAFALMSYFKYRL